jgi:hypothetical protein
MASNAGNPGDPADPRDPRDPRTALAGVIESAARLGIELDQDEAAAWVSALETEHEGGDIVVDVDSGVYGHRVSMLDFSPRDLARFRAIGEIVGFPDRPPVVLTALALSGSAAQNKVNTFPGDADFFERIHITAPTREEACAILGREMREKALSTKLGPTFRLWEVKIGSYPFDCERDGEAVAAGKPITWSPADVEAGVITVVRDGVPTQITWDQAATDPGWCKLDWIVADPSRNALANASNVLDVTWEGPDGAIVALDGFIDPDFQEVYLEAESLPLFRKIVAELSSDAVDDYVEQLQHEVVKYSTAHENFGKVARRLYNIFRLTGRYPEAAYLRELFDEPTTVLYQVAALVRTIDDAETPGGDFDVELLLKQTDELIIAAIEALEGRAEVEMVRRLMEIRQTITSHAGSDARSAAVDQVKELALSTTNDYFRERLFDVPSIATYINDLITESNAKP